MGDPFEESKPPSFPSLSQVQLRERSVQQAVDFLTDPRVKSAHPQKALTFLRHKGISDEELREAYRRCNIPFPHEAVAPPFETSHQSHPPPRYAPHPPPAGPSWVSIFLGITAVAGIYTAARELLRRYVVPLYFPDAARIADERRRREENTFQSQERQIAELSERIQDLVTSSDRTSNRMERLSKSLSSSMALRERELSEASQLRSAIHQLSQTVSISTGTSTSRAGQASSANVNEESNVMYSSHSKKRGSLAYSERAETSQPRRSVEISTDDALRNGYRQADNEYDGVRQGSSVNEYLTPKLSKTARNEGMPDEEDDFMAIQPAQVEESWSRGLESVSTVQKDIDEAKEKDHPRPSVAEPSEEVDKPLVSEEGRSDSNGTSPITVGRRDLLDEENEVSYSDAATSGGIANDTVAMRRFRFEMMQEADEVLSKSQNKDEDTSRVRPKSMPDLDIPLSDTDV